jgi:hypothetical protein
MTAHGHRSVSRSKVVAIALAPFSVLVVLLMPVIYLIGNPIVRARARRRYTELAHQLGLDEGTVLDRRFDGNMFATFQMRITCLRPGPWQSVIDAVAAGLYAKGYPEASTLKQLDRLPRRVYFNAPRVGQLPMVAVSIYGAGEQIELVDSQVPAGDTGLTFTF